MTFRYAIFLIPEDIVFDEIGYEEVVNWCVRNSTHPNALVLTQKEVYMLMYEGEVLNIINDEISWMIGEGEDGWIMLQEHKVKILERLSNYEREDIKNTRVRGILQSILKFLKIAIETDRGIYFLF